MDIYKILKFLFPEYQIIESVKKYGFVAKDETISKRHNRSFTSPNWTQAQTQAQAQGQEEMVSWDGKSLFNHHSSPKVSHEEAVYSGKTNVDASYIQIDRRIANAKRLVKKQIIGQRAAIDELFIAFKRPLVAGVKGSKPKNTFVVIGDEGIGKNSLIAAAVTSLNKEKLLSHRVSSKINLALYPTQSEKPLFLSDLYKALYMNSDVIIFRNSEKCHRDILDIIADLVIHGGYQLGARYAMQNNNLIEATGMLMQDAISELTSNNKYFVFTTHLSESKVYDLFGSKFMDNVDDIIKLIPYTAEEIVDIVEKILLEFSTYCEKRLSVVMGYSDEFIQLCASRYKKATGFKSVEDYIWKHVYKALSEYKLRNSIIEYAYVYIKCMDDVVYAEITEGGESKTVELSQYVSKRKDSSINDIKEELNNVVGLAKVKEYVLNLENNLKVQQLREAAGYKAATTSMHMIFTGNPGTGKTTIARIVAKYLKSIGVLSSGQLREVSRADLVGQYVGHTARQTNQVIQSALGGVLFIDEAYSLCRDKNDAFGLEAIDALVKGMEDYRDNLVVILAGYKEEMENFLKYNSGLKSRFPNVIDFEDYTASEMVEIADITAKAKGYRIADDCKDSLLKLFEKSQIKGRNDSGNGRLVRNVIEGAIIEQSKRILDDSKSELDILKAADFKFEENRDFNLEKALSSIIGLENVKAFVRTQYQLLVANEKRRKAGIAVDLTQSLNMVFAGNPGTGKTTVARVVADMFKSMGLLKKGQLVETDRRGLVAEYAGQTAKKTEELFKSALGGVLFIDEAYALSSDNSSYGKEAIDTLVKLIEDYRGEIVVILAGYKKEMRDFMKCNSGLQSRFPLVIDFPDYNIDELNAIALNMISARGFTIDEGARQILREQVIAAHETSTAHSGNGRMVRNMIERIVRNQSARIAVAENISKEGLTEIIPEDIEVRSKSTNTFNLEEALAPVVGLEKVKDYIRSLSARLRMQNERKKMGLPVDDSQTLHMIFKGNPGTGKTMMARVVAEVLYNIGVIRTNKLVETDRSGLVAGYVGQTAIKTAEKVSEAMDGVLFIDEAYSLAQGGANDFGREAIDTLVKLMDDNRKHLVVILAGYSKDMDDFLLTNPGLKSRFPNIIEFEDYSPEELMIIAENLYSSKAYVLSGGARAKLRSILEKVCHNKAFGNVRYVRNVFERSINNQALRLSSDTDLTKEELSTIEADDIEEV